MRFYSHILELEQVDSTQNIAERMLRDGEDVGAVFALDQIAGRGRFDRTWISAPGESFTTSFTFSGYPNHPSPWLFGMYMALAVAEIVDCDLRWPNDLSLNGKKLGGILTEVFTDFRGQRVAVVGVGVNLGQTRFPEEIADRATSLVACGRPLISPKSLLADLIAKIRIEPELVAWDQLRERWNDRDTTPGKPYLLSNGRICEAVRVNHDGSLLASVDGDEVNVLVADALFGTSK